MARNLLLGFLAFGVSCVYSTGGDISGENAEYTCTQDGFLPHPQNCKAFYWCTLRGRSLRAIVLECEDDQIFDTQSHTCTYPWLSSREECGGTSHMSNEIDRTENLRYEQSFYDPAQKPKSICLEEGYLPDENNCEKFYRCVDDGRGNYNKYEFSCSPGTVWDPEISACNHPWATKRQCRNANVETPTEQFSNNNEVTDDPYNPDWGFQPSTDLNLIEPPYASPVPHPVATTERVTVATENTEQVSYQPSYTEPSQSSTENNNVDTSVTSTCYEEGFLADSTNCKKFYRCVQDGRGGYAKYEFTCGDGTIWDIEINSCNHPFATKRSTCRSDNPNSENVNPGLTDPSGTDQNVNKPEWPNQESTSSPSYQQPQSTTYWTSSSTVSLITSEQPNSQTDQGNSSPGSENLQSTESSNRVPVDKQEGEKSSVECTEEGFMPHPENCKVFFRCVNDGRGNYIKYEFSCGEGTVWDTEGNTCNYPWATENPKCGGTLTETEFKPLENQNTTQSSSDKGEPVTTSSPDVSSWSPSPDNQKFSTATIQWESTTQSSTSSLITNAPAEGTTTASSTQNSQAQTSSESSTQVGAVTNRPFHGQDVCSQEGFIGDSKDCKKFYRCVNNGQGGFTKYEFSCGEGTVWDSDQLTCNYPWAVKNKCGESEYTNEIDSSGSSEPSNENANGSTTIGTEYVSSSTARSTLSVTDQSSTEKPLGSSTTLAPVTEQSSTEKPTNVDESSVQTVIPPESVSVSTQTEQSSTAHPTESPSASANTTEESFSAPKDQCNKEGFLADPKDCKKFYRCVANGQGGYTKYEFTCGEGTVWDSDQLTCNYPWAVRNKCGENEYTNEIDNSGTDTHSTFSTEQSSSEKVTESSTSQLTTSSTEQTSSEKVTESSSTLQTTTSSAEHSSTEERTSSTTEQSSTENPIGSFSTSLTTSSTEISSTESPTETSSTSLISSTEHSSTEAPTESTSESDQKQNVTTEAQTSTESVPEQSSTIHSTESTESSVSSSTNSSPTEESFSAPKADCTSSGFLADPNDCKKFYRCVEDGKGHYIKYEFTCGEGTVWDSDLETCNHPWAVKSKNCETKEPFNVENSTVSTSVSEKPSKETTPASSIEYTTETSSPSSGTTTSTVPAETSGPSAETTVSTVHPITETTTDINEPVTIFSTETHTEEVSTPSSPHTDQTTEKSETESSSLPNSTEQNSTITTTESPQEVTEKSTAAQTTQSVTQEPDSSTTVEQTEELSSTASPTTTTLTSKETEKPSSSVGTTTASTTSQRTEKPVTSITSTTVASTTTGELSGENLHNNKCTQEGFMPNVQDCKKFIRCVSNGKGGFTRYDFNCGGGTIWDPDINTCNYPHAVKNKKCELDSGQKEDKCTEEGFFPSSKDCKKFYRCVDNGQGSYTKYDFMCGEGTIWDPNLLTCNYPGSAENEACGHSYSFDNNTTVNDTKTDKPTTTTAKEETTTPEKVTTTSPEETTTPEKVTTTSPEETTTPEKVTTTSPEETTTEKDSKTEAPCSTTSKEETTTHTETTTVETGTETTEFLTTHESTTQTETTEHTTDTHQETSTVLTTESSTIVGSTITEQSESTTDLSTHTTTELTSTEAEHTSTELHTDQTTDSSTTASTESDSSTTKLPETTDSSTTSITESDSSTTNVPETTDSSTTPATESDSSTTNLPESTTQEDQTTTTSLTTESTEHSTVVSTMDNSDHSTVTSITESLTESTSFTTDITGSTQEETTTSSTVTETTTDFSHTEQTTESSSNQTTSCPISQLENDQISLVCPTGFRRHPMYCNLFYQCTSNSDTFDIKVLVMSCPVGTIYDDEKIQCLSPEESNQVCRGHIAEPKYSRRFAENSLAPLEIESKKPLCPNEGTFTMDQTQCDSNFIKCQTSTTEKRSMRGFIYQCPKGYTYWSISRRCEEESPALGCGDEEPYEMKWGIPVETQNVAPSYLKRIKPE